MMDYAEAVIWDQIWRIESGGNIQIKTTTGGKVTHAAYNKQREKTKQADAEHQRFMAYMARALGVGRSKVILAMMGASKKELEKLCQQYEDTLVA